MTEELGATAEMARHSGNIALVYADQNNFTKALEYNFKALNSYESMELKAQIGNILGNIGVIYTKTGENSKALDFSLKALNEAEDLGVLGMCFFMFIYKKRKY